MAEFLGCVLQVGGLIVILGVGNYTYYLATRSNEKKPFIDWDYTE